MFQIDNHDLMEGRAAIKIISKFKMKEFMQDFLTK